MEKRKAEPSPPTGSCNRSNTLCASAGTPKSFRPTHARAHSANPQALPGSEGAQHQIAAAELKKNNVFCFIFYNFNYSDNYIFLSNTKLIVSNGLQK